MNHRSLYRRMCDATPHIRLVWAGLAVLFLAIMAFAGEWDTVFEIVRYWLWRNMRTLALMIVGIAIVYLYSFGHRLISHHRYQRKPRNHRTRSTRRG